MSDWYGDWQSEAHSVVFDGRARLGRHELIRNYECLNDVRMLKERIDPSRSLDLLEIGCATGELYRYLRWSLPAVRYAGLDISHPAVARAKAKYPQGSFFIVDPQIPLRESLKQVGLPEHPEIVYAKDVVQHQVHPFKFLSEVLQVASDMVILRCRTRDVGATELNPDLSCQYHYDGWMPYLVLNLHELLHHLQAQAPECEVVVYRHYVILGGQNRRFLPKELYLKETGTAETAVGIFKNTPHPNRVLVRNQPDGSPPDRWEDALKRGVRRVMEAARR